jgi:hypothetical protein
VAAFLASAGITILATALCLLLSRNFADEGKITINPLDGIFRHCLCDRIQKVVNRANPYTASLWADCAFDLVISLSDQQLVTGLAILIAGTVRLHSAQIAVYHFAIVADLAWFSSNTHILSLLVVRSYQDSVKRLPSTGERADDEEQAYYSRQGIKWLRVFLMVVMATLLMYTSWVAGYEYWDSELDCPAKCTLRGNRGGSRQKWMGADFFYVLSNYPLHIFMLIRKFRIHWIDDVRPRLLDGVSQPDNRRNLSMWEKGPLLLRLFGRVCLCIWYFLSSELIAFVEVLVWYGLGVSWLFKDRKAGHAIMKDSGAEMKWGFGQLVPLFLVALPLMQVAESYARHSYAAKKAVGDRLLSGRKRGKTLLSSRQSTSLGREDIQLDRVTPAAAHS